MAMPAQVMVDAARELDADCLLHHPRCSDSRTAFLDFPSTGLVLDRSSQTLYASVLECKVNGRVLVIETQQKDHRTGWDEIRTV